MRVQGLKANLLLWWMSFELIWWINVVTLASILLPLISIRTKPLFFVLFFFHLKQWWKYCGEVFLCKLKSNCLDQSLYLWCWPKWSQLRKQDCNSSSTHLPKIDTQMVTLSFLTNLIKHLCKSLFFCFHSRHPTSFN